MAGNYSPSSNPVMSKMMVQKAICYRCLKAFIITPEYTNRWFVGLRKRPSCYVLSWNIYVCLHLLHRCRLAFAQNSHYMKQLVLLFIPIEISVG